MSKFEAFLNERRISKEKIWWRGGDDETEIEHEIILELLQPATGFDYVGPWEQGFVPDKNALEQVGDWYFGDAGDNFIEVWNERLKQCWCCHPFADAELRESFSKWLENLIKVKTGYQTFKLSELYRIYQIGEIEIYEGGDSYRLHHQERNFHLGQLTNRYDDRIGDEISTEKGYRKVTKRDIKKWVADDLAIYKRLQKECTEWLTYIDSCTTFLQEYFPDYTAWDGFWYSTHLEDIVMDLGRVGAIAWDILIEPADTQTVLNFLYSKDNCDDLQGLAKSAFQSGRFDILLAVTNFPKSPLTPQKFWKQEITKHLGTDELLWFKICQYPIVQDIDPVLGELARLDTPPDIQYHLREMMQSINPDGTPTKKPEYQNVFKRNYASNYFARGLAATMCGVQPNKLGNDYDFKTAIAHKEFVEWHNRTVEEIGVDVAKQIYERVFGIGWGVIEEILTSLPPLYWIILGFDPRQPITKAELKKLYHSKMQQVHPDVGGDKEEAKRVTAAYEEALTQQQKHGTSSRRV